MGFLYRRPKNLSMKNNLYNGIKERLFYTLGKRPEIATPHDFYMALS